MKLEIIFVLLLISGYLTMETDIPCNEGCISCDPVGFCRTCYKRKMDPKKDLQHCNNHEETEGNCLYYSVEDEEPESTCT